MNKGKNRRTQTLISAKVVIKESNRSYGPVPIYVSKREADLLLLNDEAVTASVAGRVREELRKMGVGMPRFKLGRDEVQLY